VLLHLPKALPAVSPPLLLQPLHQLPPLSHPPLPKWL
jgi:hypothetical protein